MYIVSCFCLERSREDEENNLVSGAGEVQRAKSKEQEKYKNRKLNLKLLKSFRLSSAPLSTRPPLTPHALSPRSPMSESKDNSEDRERRREAKDAADSAVLKRAMSYCWSESFLGRFRVFFADHAYVFEEHARANMRLR